MHSASLKSLAVSIGLGDCPCPQFTAIAAGSVFRITLDGNITPNELKTLEDTGIGERRAKGFGALMISTDTPDPEKFEDDDWIPVATDQAEYSTNRADLSVEDNQLAETMLARLLRRELDEVILNTARNMIVE